MTLAGCVRFTYSVRHAEEPLEQTTLVALQTGTDDLGSCLTRLGAPHFVWEYHGDGMALGWVASEESGWGFSISYNPFRYANPSLSLDQADQNLPGVVLWFDRDLRLTEWRRGRMRDLTSNLRRRPAASDGG